MAGSTFAGASPVAVLTRPFDNCPAYDLDNRFPRSAAANIDLKMNHVLRNVFADPVAVAFAVVGVLLLGVALHFGVNPADGSVVDASIRETWIPIALFIASLPAMAVMFLTGGGVIGLPLMYLAQIIVYWGLGRAVSWAVSAAARSTRRG
jgi:hypothetical protein